MNHQPTENSKLQPLPGKPLDVIHPFVNSTEMLLIRHGESEGNVGLSSDPNCRLTSRGVEQARSLGVRLGQMDLSGFQAICSPYRRTIDTAEQISAHSGLLFSSEELIREWGDVATVGAKQFHKETLEEMIARMQEFLHHYAGRRIVVVSHAAPIAVLTQLAWGETPNTEGKFWTSVHNCSLRWLKATSEKIGNERNARR